MLFNAPLYRRNESYATTYYLNTDDIPEWLSQLASTLLVHFATIQFLLFLYLITTLS
jgi:hypothetical protein